MPSSKNQQVVQAQVAHVPSLKSCLVNLPAALVAVLSNANTLAQNVIAELTFRQTIPPASEKDKVTSIPRSIFVGWTGMQSQRKAMAVVGRDGLAGSRGSSVREQDIVTVEIDPIFARLIGLTEGQKVGVILHVDPPQAHTINIEPLTPADWEMIELSAHFLETNFLSQVRVVPNPAFTEAEGSIRIHPIALHLSPTSTVNFSIADVTPKPSPPSPFVKISPDAEIIVAPKERQRQRSGSNLESRSGKKSVGGRSAASTIRKKSTKGGSHPKASVELRGIDRSTPCDIFDEDDTTMRDDGLKVWIHPSLTLHRPLKGTNWVSVSIAKPVGVIEKPDPQKDLDQTDKPSLKIIAKLATWQDAIDSRHIVLSSLVCKSLSVEGLVGGLVRIQPASSPLDPSTVKFKDLSQKVGLKVIPFIPEGGASQNSGIKFGGETKSEKEESARKLRELFSLKFGGNGLIDGPLSDGMFLPDMKPLWHGGILKIDPPVPVSDTSDAPVPWIIAPEKPLPIDFQSEVRRPTTALRNWSPGDAIPHSELPLVGVDATIEQLVSNLSEGTPVLLTGGLGAGKTVVSQIVAHRLQNEELFHTIYFPCRTKMTGEYKVTNIQETLNRLFATASWGAELGGKAIVILDDLDAICFAETELGEGGDNVRSQNISACLSTIIKTYCSKDSGVVLLATAQSKEALNNLIISSHVIEETVNILAPNKELRRKVLEAVLRASPKNQTDPEEFQDDISPESSPTKSISSKDSGIKSSSGFTISPSLDFLDLAGQTDGYMPGDLVLLVSRTRSECLIRTIGDSGFDQDKSDSFIITAADFAAAIKGFTPASLRNVTLQSSSVKWSSIGGLQETRQILLETLQYPTTYAPIFSKCSLRLRSGILLYGYPGCGKTLLASAIATECGLNFISVKGPEILNKYIGASEKSVRDLFERAQAAKPCVLFFDEFDAIAPKRGHDSTGVTDRVVNQLLTQMDGAEGLDGVYVLGATSRPDLIDPALLRPGRLDKSIICDMPSYDDRIDILHAVASGLKMSPEMASKWPIVAQRTEGYSGADLQALIYNAHLEAVHELLGTHYDSAKFGGNSNSSSITTTTNAGAHGGAPSTNGSPSPSSAAAAAARRTPLFDVWTMSDDAAAADPQPPTNLAARSAVAARLREMQSAKRKRRDAARAAAGMPVGAKMGSSSAGLRGGGGAAGQRSQSQSQSYSQHHHQQQQIGGKEAAFSDEEDEDDDDVFGAKGGEEEPDEDDGEPTVQWRHVQGSLLSTRASISPEERGRLGRIYREFVSGRSGDLPTGEGGTEIGGRTSLM